MLHIIRTLHLAHIRIVEGFSTLELHSLLLLLLLKQVMASLQKQTQE